jgi:CheY-like chemotaxis protein
MDKILIIDDRKQDYLDIIDTLGVDNYNFIPEFISEDDCNFRNLQRALNNNELSRYVAEQIRTHSDDLKVIICDYELSDYLDGIDIIRGIRAAKNMEGLEDFCKSVPIIFHSSTSNSKIIERGKECGANCFIGKGNRAGLIEAINSFI